MKTDDHPRCTARYPPIVGASRGETPKMRINIEKTFALSLGSNKSLTIAKAATLAEHPPAAWINLNIMSDLTELEKAQAIEARI
jgi:hypothetical protein